jgi:transcriptional regulator
MLVLKTLSIGVMHGYGIAQHIRQVSGDVLHVEEGSLYPALQRLLREGLVKAEWGLSATNRRVRRYRLTPAGAKHLEHAASSFEAMLEAIMRVLAPGTA